METVVCGETACHLQPVAVSAYSSITTANNNNNNNNNNDDDDEWWLHNVEVHCLILH